VGDVVQVEERMGHIGERGDRGREQTAAQTEPKCREQDGQVQDATQDVVDPDLLGVCGVVQR
jgi:hypothetical protein